MWGRVPLYTGMSIFNETMARYKQARQILQPFMDLMVTKTVINEEAKKRPEYYSCLCPQSQQ